MNACVVCAKPTRRLCEFRPTALPELVVLLSCYLCQRTADTYDAGSYDVCLCCLALHYVFTPQHQSMSRLGMHALATSLCLGQLAQRVDACRLVTLFTGVAAEAERGDVWGERPRQRRWQRRGAQLRRHRLGPGAGVSARRRPRLVLGAARPRARRAGRLRAWPWCVAVSV